MPIFAILFFAILFQSPIVHAIEENSASPSLSQQVPAAWTLDQVMREKLVGVENLGIAPAATSVQWAEDYLAFKNQGKKGIYRFCEDRLASDAICQWVMGTQKETPWLQVYVPDASSAVLPFELKTGALGKRRKNVYDPLLQPMTEGWTESFHGLTFKEIGITLNSVKTKADFERIIESWWLEHATSATCVSPIFLSMLALKAEDFLPDPKIRDWIVSLYDQVLECGGLNADQRARALYRQSLFLLWKKDCVAAVPRLQMLSNLHDSDFSSRALFWLARCSKELKNEKDFLSYRERLTRLNPMGYQVLLLNHGMAPGAWTDYASCKLDPAIEFRSTLNPGLNAVIETAEILIQQGHANYAQDLIRLVEKTDQPIETSVKLYLAALSLRLGDSFTVFRLVDSSLKHEPEKINEAVLKLFFPLKYFASIEKHRGSVDPYLIAALIRQESGFTPSARSPVGALGLMQLRPSTAWLTGKVSRFRLVDPESNIKVGIRYLKILLDRYDGDVELALAAYNAGPMRVDDWINRYATEDRSLFLDLIPFLETRKYVSLINRNFFWYTLLYQPVSQSAQTPRAPASSPTPSPH